MCILPLEKKERIEFQYGRLFKEFGWTLTKVDLANVLGVSLRKVDEMVSGEVCPKFKKLGKGKRSGVMFFTYDVAMWMCE